MSLFRVLCLGDIVARPGRKALQADLPELKKKHAPDLTIVNAENASGGTGLEAGEAEELLSFGADVLTMGDHTWRYSSLHRVLEDEQMPVVKPANYPRSTPGKRFFVVETKGMKIGVLNLLGRVFVDSNIDSPFEVATGLLKGELARCDITLCDFHAEATSEKIAFAKHFDGKFSLVFGTHTHVPTADAQILPHGTGYVTDLGMCGSPEGVIGLDTEVALKRFLTGMAAGYKAATGQGILSGIIAEIDVETKKTINISRI